MASEFKTTNLALKPLARAASVSDHSRQGTADATREPQKLAVVTVNRPDTARRSIPPGGKPPRRYQRNIVAEVLAARYGEDSRLEMEAEEAAADLKNELSAPKARRRFLGSGPSGGPKGGKGVSKGAASGKESGKDRKKGFFGL